MNSRRRVDILDLEEGESSSLTTDQRRMRGKQRKSYILWGRLVDVRARFLRSAYMCYSSVRLVLFNEFVLWSGCVFCHALAAASDTHYRQGESQ